jgi:LysM repeat protein
MKRFHIVGRNENLSGISKEYQVPLSDLININSIKNPNILHPGQRIMLRKSDVLGVRVIFLDKDRNAISGLFYVLEFCGKSVEGKTEADGMSKKIVTDRASDKVRILIERLDGTRKELALVESGYGNKLVTTVSENVMITAKTENIQIRKPVRLEKKTLSPRRLIQIQNNLPLTRKKIWALFLLQSKLLMENH